MKKIILFVIASLLLIGCNSKEEKQDINDKPITDLSIIIYLKNGPIKKEKILN